MADHSDNPIQGCKEYEEALVLYYYGELEDRELSRMEAHLKACDSCCQALESMRSLLPLTVSDDQPPQSFWDDYSREVRFKLDRADEKQGWWNWIYSFVRPWPIPAAAAAVVLVLALTLTLNRAVRNSGEAPPANEEILEMIRIGDDVEFFKNLDLLESMDLLEGQGAFSNGPESA